MVIEVATLISWLLHLLSKRCPIKWHNLNWGYLGFIAVIATTVLTATNNRYAYDVFMALIVWFVMFMIGTNVIN